MSTPHESSSFRFLRRLRKADPATAPAPGRPSTGPLTVVLADDVQALRALVRATLEPDFEVIAEAGDGREAVRACRETHPDVIVLDLNMPAHDGLEAIQPIREQSPGTAIVVLTGLAPELIADKALALGADRFVDKAEPIENLPAILREAAAGHS